MLLRRIGRRGTILLILAFIDFAYGASLIGPSSEALSTASVRWREHFAPTWAWGGAWLLVGAILLVSAFMKHDVIGYVAAISLKIIWGLVTLASWILGNVPRGWIGAIIWLVFAAMVGVISGWPESTWRVAEQRDGNDG